MNRSHESIVEDHLSAIRSTVNALLEIMDNEDSNAGSPEEQLDCWAIVELFGHNKIAGKIKTVSLAGGAMLRVDVPAIAEQKAYTRFFGNKAIYSINPVSEAVATGMVSQCHSAPVKEYELPKQLTAGEVSLPVHYQEDPES